MKRTFVKKYEEAQYELKEFYYLYNNELRDRDPKTGEKLEVKIILGKDLKNATLNGKLDLTHIHDNYGYMISKPNENGNIMIRRMTMKDETRVWLSDSYNRAIKNGFIEIM